MRIPSAMLISITFFLALAITVAAAFTTLQSGRRGDRRAHLVRALSTVVLLAVTVVMAHWLGKHREFPEELMAIHKIIARVAGLMVVPVVCTGIMLWHRPSWRIAHRTCVYVFLAGILVATGTGIWVFALSSPVA